MSKTHVKATVPIDANVRIGHVHLKVSDIERAIAFYRDILGFEVTQRFGEQAAFLSAAHTDDQLARVNEAVERAAKAL